MRHAADQARMGERPCGSCEIILEETGVRGRSLLCGGILPPTTAFEIWLQATPNDVRLSCTLAVLLQPRRSPASSAANTNWTGWEAGGSRLWLCQEAPLAAYRPTRMRRPHCSRS